MRLLITILPPHDVVRCAALSMQGQQAFPGLGIARQDHIASRRVAPDEDLASVEAEFERQPNRLTASGGEKLRGLGAHTSHHRQSHKLGI